MTLGSRIDVEYSLLPIPRPRPRACTGATRGRRRRAGGGGRARAAALVHNSQASGAFEYFSGAPINSARRPAKLGARRCRLVPRHYLRARAPGSSPPPRLAAFGAGASAATDGSRIGASKQTNRHEGEPLFITFSRGKRAREPPGSKWSSSPINTRINSALSAAWIKTGFLRERELMEGEWTTGTLTRWTKCHNGSCYFTFRHFMSPADLAYFRAVAKLATA
ncbi:hypothetical protein EVAR_47648_1 [Eumeta japonica]|uniref:Uncharacterized protein n=1 Tax=Eumeta variegata TaxID=151549 RepID=A0A4C1Y101_EUMVA|nr:hypothetical protein EVAR_47648_1 [Eumeta japonica]